MSMILGLIKSFQGIFGCRFYKNAGIFTMMILTFSSGILASDPPETPAQTKLKLDATEKENAIVRCDKAVEDYKEKKDEMVKACTAGFFGRNVGKCIEKTQACEVVIGNELDETDGSSGIGNLASLGDELAEAGCANKTRERAEESKEKEKKAAEASMARIKDAREAEQEAQADVGKAFDTLEEETIKTKQQANDVEIKGKARIEKLISDSKNAVKGMLKQAAQLRTASENLNSQLVNKKKQKLLAVEQFKKACDDLAIKKATTQRFCSVNKSTSITDLTNQKNACSVFTKNEYKRCLSSQKITLKVNLTKIDGEIQELTKQKEQLAVSMETLNDDIKQVAINLEKNVQNAAADTENNRNAILERQVLLTNRVARANQQAQSAQRSAQAAMLSEVLTNGSSILTGVSAPLTADPSGMPDKLFTDVSPFVESYLDAENNAWSVCLCNGAATAPATPAATDAATDAATPATPAATPDTTDKTLKNLNKAICVSDADRKKRHGSATTATAE